MVVLASGIRRSKSYNSQILSILDTTAPSGQARLFGMMACVLSANVALLGLKGCSQQNAGGGAHDPLTMVQIAEESHLDAVWLCMTTGPGACLADQQAANSSYMNSIHMCGR